MLDDEYELRSIQADVDALLQDVRSLTSRVHKIGLAIPSEWAADTYVRYNRGLQREWDDLHSQAVALRGRCERSISWRREIIDRQAWDEVEPYHPLETRALRMEQYCAECARVEHSLALVKVAIDRLNLVP